MLEMAAVATPAVPAPKIVAHVRHFQSPDAWLKVGKLREEKKGQNDVDGGECMLAKESIQLY